MAWCLRSVVPTGVWQGQAENGGIVLAAGAGPRVSSGGVTRQGVVLTDLQSPVDCKKYLLLLLAPARKRAHAKFTYSQATNDEF